MKDIKIRTSWSKVLKNEDGWSDSDKSNIILDVDVEGVNWNLGCDIMDSLENRINEDGFYYCTREGCPDFNEEEKTFLDCLIFERNYGSIREQRREVLKYVNNIKKEVIKEVLKEQEEQEEEQEVDSMKNIKIKKTNRGYYTVIADTQKFGTNEILFEGRNIEECKNYIKRTLIFILKAQLLKNRTQEAENTIKTLISYLNDKKQKTINNNIAKSWELFSTGAINMEISETEKGYYFVGEQAPIKFTFFIDKEGKDTRKQKNDKVVNTLTEDFTIEF